MPLRTYPRGCGQQCRGFSRIKAPELRAVPSAEISRMAEPPTPQTTQVLTCIECGRLWVQPQERWRLYVTDEEQPERVAYCQACAEREFDSD
jgi:hypothetical protein